MDAINRKSGDVPEFLQQSITDHDRTMVRRAYARYLVTKNWSPEEGAKVKLGMRALLFHLRDMDHRWRAVEAEVMTTTHPLVHGMNSFMYRWKHHVGEIRDHMEEEHQRMRAADEADMTAQQAMTASEQSGQEDADADHEGAALPVSTGAFAGAAQAETVAQPAPADLEEVKGGDQPCPPAAQ